MAVLKNIVDIDHNIALRFRRETPAGAAEQVRPRRRFSAEEAHRPPREPLAPGTEINIHF
jgi:hypothetical protein